jgi:hypothetical protein
MKVIRGKYGVCDRKFKSYEESESFKFFQVPWYPCQGHPRVRPSLLSKYNAQNNSQNSYHNEEYEKAYPSLFAVSTS